SDPCTDVTPALTGSFGSVTEQPYLVTGASLLTYNEGQVAQISTVIVGSHAGNFSLDIAAGYPTGTDFFLFYDSGALSSTLTTEGSISDLNSFLASVRILPPDYFNGEMFIVLSLQSPTGDLLSKVVQPIQFTPVNDPISVSFSTSAINVGSENSQVN